MTVTVESLSYEILSKMGVSSQSELASLLPSAHTTDAHIKEAELSLKGGHIEDAFHQLSLSHSTLLYHRITQKLYKPSQRSSSEDPGGMIAPPDLLEAEKATLASNTKDDTINLLRSLPSDWTVVQITAQRLGENCYQKSDGAVPTPGLYVARCSCGPDPHITLQSVASPRAEGVRGIIQELKVINEEKRVLYKEYKGKYQGQSAVLDQLQDRLKNVVHSMGESWLRQWCCLLMGSLPPDLQHELDQAISRTLPTHAPLLTHTQTQLLKLVMSCPEVGEKGGGWSGGGINLRAAVASILSESVRSTAVKELCAAIKTEEAVLSPIRLATRNPVILILDKSVETLPWEMVWVLRDQPVTRMPSLRMLALLYKHHSSMSGSVLCECVDARRGFYVLDPENNLPRTVERLTPALALTGWPGVTSTKPSLKELKEALSTKDVFVYAGHGSGSQYLPGEVVEGTWCRALVLLFGCRSVHLAPRGRIPDTWGVVLNYLIAYCPCVVGMLWDVTDKDTDLLTLDLLQGLQGRAGPPTSPLAAPPSDLALLVAQSRALCRSTLTAAALAVYGLPLHLLSPLD